MNFVHMFCCSHTLTRIIPCCSYCACHMLTHCNVLLTTERPLKQGNERKISVKLTILYASYSTLLCIVSVLDILFAVHIIAYVCLILQYYYHILPQLFFQSFLCRIKFCYSYTISDYTIMKICCSQQNYIVFSFFFFLSFF